MRLEGWEARLAAVIRDAASKPYWLGEHDCFRFACKAVEALTGVDRWPEFRGRYSNRREALALLARHGKTFEAAFDWFFGVPRVGWRRARRGDIGAFQTPDGEKHLGVCNGRDVVVLLSKGITPVPAAFCGAFWQIG